MSSYIYFFIVATSPFYFSPRYTGFVQQHVDICWHLRAYVTITWGAVINRSVVAIIVKSGKVRRQSLSETMAANFQSFSILAESSSFLIISVITRSSLRIIVSSLRAPEGNLMVWNRINIKKWIISVNYYLGKHKFKFYVPSQN